MCAVECNEGDAAMITLTRDEAQQVLHALSTEGIGEGSYRTAELLRARLGAPEPATCGYDETTGNCTQNPCCYPAPPQLEPSVEPVAWIYNGKLHEFDPSDWAEGDVTSLYASPPQRNEPEPWAGVDFDIKTAPPQREFIGLTDEEIMSLLPGAVRLPPGWSETVRAIEAKLKEKNA